MALVLAIEPDRRQAAHLTAIARHLMDAELVLADTTENALDAIGNRVPDLVLVPALLSPQDDAALAAALRVIAAASHVRTLTIPVLANGAKPKPAGGMLAKWRRSRAESPEPEGCEPAVFGEQISAYLKEAAAERAELESDPFEEQPAAAFHPAPVAPVPAEARELWTAEPPAWPADAAGEIADAGTHKTDDDDTDDETGGEPVIDLSDELADLAEDEPEGQLFEGERVGVYTISAELEEPAIEAFDLLPPVLEPPPLPAHVTRDADDASISLVGAAVDGAPEAPFGKPAWVEPATAAPVFVESMLVESCVPMFLTPGRLWPSMEGMPAEPPAARREQPDWIELVASLRQDLVRRRTDPASAVAEPPAARPSDGAKAEAHTRVKKQKAPSKKSRPAQDEWGFFDPEQCGFSMLLAKLDEITEDLSEV